MDAMRKANQTLRVVEQYGPYSEADLREACSEATHYARKMLLLDGDLQTHMAAGTRSWLDRLPELCEENGAFLERLGGWGDLCKRAKLYPQYTSFWPEEAVTKLRMRPRELLELAKAVPVSSYLFIHPTHLSSILLPACLGSRLVA